MAQAPIETVRGRFASRDAGPADAPLVVALHGFPDDSSTFDALAQRLVENGRRIVAPSLRGYAPSPVDGDLSLPGLVDDLIAQLDVLAPGRRVALIGHDYGAQIGYAALARHPGRFDAAVLLAGAHPEVVVANARRMPKQWWMSRYIVFFQLPKLADWAVARNDFAYVERLWRRWSPGFTVAPEHLRRVKATLAASMPGPIAMYRAGGFGIGRDPIAVPTRFIGGRDDGCLLPALAAGQDQLFTTAYDEQIWDGTGHFVHLEQPERTAEAVVDWFDRYHGDSG